MSDRHTTRADDPRQIPPALPAPPDRPLLTARQVAELLGVDKDTVLDWRARGLLREAARLPGGSYRFAWADVSALVQARDAVTRSDEIVVAESIIGAAVRRARG